MHNSLRGQLLISIKPSPTIHPSSSMPTSQGLSRGREWKFKFLPLSRHHYAAISVFRLAASILIRCKIHLYVTRILSREYWRRVFFLCLKISTLKKHKGFSSKICWYRLYGYFVHGLSAAACYLDSSHYLKKKLKVFKLFVDGRIEIVRRSNYLSWMETFVIAKGYLLQVWKR